MMPKNKNPIDNSSQNSRTDTKPKDLSCLSQAQNAMMNEHPDSSRKQVNIPNSLLVTPR